MPSPENALIQALPRTDRARLLALCDTVPLNLGEVLCEPGQVSRYAYFPTAGFISLIAQVDAQHGVEVSMAGSEGMVGVHLLLGSAPEPLKALVQGSGSALRLGATAFRRELNAGTALRLLLNRYLSAVMTQRALSAACVRFHEIGPRLARWLLMSEDRAHAPSFPMTQEFVSAMLGVRRVGITAAAGSLQKAGLIHYHRGLLQVLDRAGLMAAACSCYAADQRSSALAMGTVGTVGTVGAVGTIGTVGMKGGAQ